MAIKSRTTPEPSLTMQEIVNEFGGTQPHSLSEYYRGGTLVPNLTSNNNIPQRGSTSLPEPSIAFDDFYGATDFRSVSFTVPAVNTTTWYNNVTLEDYTTAFNHKVVGEAWANNVVDFLADAAVNFGPTLIRVPQFVATIQSNRDSDLFDDDEYTGIRRPGIRIRNPSGTPLGDDVRATQAVDPITLQPLFDSRGNPISSQVFGNQTKTILIPSFTLNATQTGTYKIYFIADIYRSPEGDAALMRWTSNTFNVSWETR